MLAAPWWPCVKGACAVGVGDPGGRYARFENRSGTRTGNGHIFSRSNMHAGAGSARFHQQTSILAPAGLVGSRDAVLSPVPRHHRRYWVRPVSTVFMSFRV